LSIIDFDDPPSNHAAETSLVVTPSRRNVENVLRHGENAQRHGDYVAENSPDITPSRRHAVTEALRHADTAELYRPHTLKTIDCANKPSDDSPCRPGKLHSTARPNNLNPFLPNREIIDLVRPAEGKTFTSTDQQLRSTQGLHQQHIDHQLQPTSSHDYYNTSRKQQYSSTPQNPHQLQWQHPSVNTVNEDIIRKQHSAIIDQTTSATTQRKKLLKVQKYDGNTSLDSFLAHFKNAAWYTTSGMMKISWRT
jgi:hypothetical protein